jgi:hypothetical protein
MTEIENINKINDLKTFDNFVAVRHLLFVDGRQQPLARQETKRKPTGCANPRFLETGSIGEKNDLPYNRY